MINKIEGNQRRPSLELARLLAQHLKIPDQDYPTFLRLARPDLPPDQFELPNSPENLSSQRQTPRLGASWPATPTSLIGRAPEADKVCSLLRSPEVRLVTLTGPGGTGKTRLGLHVAATLREEFKQGVYFVNLAPIRNPELVLSALAQALGIKEFSHHRLRGVLLDHLADKHMLFLLDNFEQVLAAAKDIAGLLAAPGVKLLVTSRARLHLYGEHEFVVSPLGLPPLQLPLSVEVLAQSPAVALFVQRAQAAKADFALTSENAAVIAKICARLDGLPLAIELAAAQIKLMSPPRLLSKLTGDRPEPSLEWLADGAVDLPARQRTMRRTIGWSYDLLNEKAQTLFRRLGVFVGGCTLEAARAVYAEEDEGRRTNDQELRPSSRGAVLRPLNVLTLMTALVNQSLVQPVEGVNGDLRYTMLETVREYALEQLEAWQELETVRQRQAVFLVELAEAAQEKSSGPQQNSWLRQLEAEHDNLRAALTWSCASPLGAEVGLHLAAVVWDFWLVRGYVEEGRSWLAKLLARPEVGAPTPVRAQALNGAGLLAWAQGDSRDATELLSESLFLFRSLGDRAGSAWALSHLGDVALAQSEFQQAIDFAEESLKLFQEAGTPWEGAWALLTLGIAVWACGEQVRAAAFIAKALDLFQQSGDKQGFAWAAEHLGNIEQAQGNHAEAGALLAESLELFREMGDKAGTAWALNHLGRIAQAQGEAKRAKAFFTESLHLFRELNNPRGSAWCLVGLAGLVSPAARGARLLGVAEGLLAAGPEKVSPSDQEYYDRILAAVAAQLEAQAFAEARAAGRALTSEEGIRDAVEKEEGGWLKDEGLA